MDTIDKCDGHDNQTGRESAPRTVWARRALLLGYWKQFIEKFRKKWTKFARDTVVAIAQEEMKISREEFDKQVGSRTR